MVRVRHFPLLRHTITCDPAPHPPLFRDLARHPRDDGGDPPVAEARGRGLGGGAAADGGAPDGDAEVPGALAPAARAGRAATQVPPRARAHVAAYANAGAAVAFPARGPEAHRDGRGAGAARGAAV